MISFWPERRNLVNQPVASNNLYDWTIFGDGLESLMGLDGGFSQRNSQFKCDIRSNANEYVITMDAPGVKNDEIDINFENSLLTITVERNEEHEDDKQSYHLRERIYGKFSRSFKLTQIDEKSIDAVLKNGVLTVTAPRTSTTKQSKIKVTT